MLQTLSIFVKTWRRHITKIQVSSILQLMIFAPKIPHTQIVSTYYTKIYKSRNYTNLYRLSWYMLIPNKYERYYWTRKAPTCLLTLLCHYCKPHLCINVHHYARPIGCSVTQRAATSLAAAGR